MGAANMFFLSTLAFSSLFAQTAFSLRVASGSPCWDVCSDSSPKNTTGDDIVCRDSMYVDTRAGRRFQECVSCELESTHVLKRYDESDVEWGLYNIRYAFSSCIFAYPVEKQSISTPCQVSCESLRDAIQYGITDPDGYTSYDFCTLDSFDDSVITKCGDCYSETQDEKYLANFMEALRQGCHNRDAEPGLPFVLDPTRIFNTERIPASTESAEADSKEGDGKPDNLVLIIVLPIVGFIVLLALGCCGCFFLVRRRRRRAREQGQATHLDDTSIMTPFPGGLQKLWKGDPAANQPMSPQHQYGAYNPGFYQPEPPTPQHGDIKYPPEAYMMGPNPLHQQQYQYSQQYQQYQQQYQHVIPPVSQEQYVHETPQTPGGQIQQTVVPVKQEAQVPILSSPPRKSMGANPEKSD